MLDIGWTEIVVVAVVALVVLGPKELPRALKTFGAVMAKARSMAREFQSGVDEMIRESELDDLRKDLQNATRIDFDETPAKRIDPTTGDQAAIPADPAPAQAALQDLSAAPPAAETGIAGEPPTEAAATGAIRQAPASDDPTAPPAATDPPSGTASSRPVDAPPLGAQGFDRDYAGATEIQAAGDFLPPETAEDAGDGGTPVGRQDPDEAAADRASGASARAAE